MSLTKDSLIEAAQVKAKSARRQAKTAKAELEVANDELEAAIDAGATAKVRRAIEHTRIAEVAVTDAAVNMDKVDGLLDLASTAAPVEKR